MIDISRFLNLAQINLEIIPVVTLRQSARVSLRSQQSVVTFPWLWKIGFHAFLPTFYSEPRTVTETLWMRVFPFVNLGSGDHEMVNIKICRLRCVISFIWNIMESSTRPCFIVGGSGGYGAGRVIFHFLTNFTNSFILLDTTFVRLWPEKGNPFKDLGNFYQNHSYF